jgi:hypothetical protein
MFWRGKRLAGEQIPIQAHDLLIFIQLCLSFHSKDIHGLAKRIAKSSSR